MIDFPASPTVNQQFTAAGVTWTWDGTKWLPAGLSPTVVGGINDNRLINGDMRIDQRNNGASGTGGGYTVDRWQFQGGTSTKGSWVRAASPVAGFPYSLKFTSSSAYTPVAADYYQFLQPIEADAISDFAWGTANAQPVTLSFWASSSLSGLFSGALNSGARGCPFSFSLVANTWTKVAVTIPGDTAGAWTLSGNGNGLQVVFNLGAGSNYLGPAGAWGSVGYIGATGSVSIVATNGANFQVTGVKLETGSVATPFNRQSLAKSMADCQRYFWDAANGGSSGVIQVSAYGATGGGAGYFGSVKLPVTMRATPTVTPRNLTYTNCSAISSGSLCPDFMYVQATITAPGAGIITFNASLSAEL